MEQNVGRSERKTRLHVAGMRMLQWIRGKTRKDHLRNQAMQDDAKVCQMSTFPTEKIKLVWAHQEKTRTMTDMVVGATGEEKKGAA